MKELSIWGIEISPAIYVPVLYFLWVSILLIAKKVFFTKVRRFADKTVIELDDIILDALDLPLLLLIFVSGVYVLDYFFQFRFDGTLLMSVDIAFKSTAIIAIVIFVDRLFKGLVDRYAEKAGVLKNSGGMMHLAVRAIVMILGVLILLDSFGVSITPLLASLGVGSLAVALALQPTLENFFSGVQLVIDKPIVVGQFIRLDSGEEGYVEKIGWRSTWVRMLPNNVVVIPNKVLVSSRILNYHYPQKEISILIDVGVHYDSDLEHVEKITLEVANGVLKSVEGGVAGFDPFIRYHTFGDSSIDFKVILRAKEFVDGYRIKHEFIKSLHKRYREEGIIIPYPIQTLDWNEGSSPLKFSKKE